MKRFFAILALAVSCHAQIATNLSGFGTYLGMIAKPDGRGGVMMFSATSGELLRWIPFAEFERVYVNKSKPEYPANPDTNIVAFRIFPTFSSNSVPVVIEITERNQWAIRRLITRQIAKSNSPYPPLDAVTNMVVNMFRNQLTNVTRFEEHLFQQEEQDAVKGAHPEIRRRVHDLVGITNAPPPLPQ